MLLVRSERDYDVGKHGFFLLFEWVSDFGFANWQNVFFLLVRSERDRDTTKRYYVTIYIFLLILFVFFKGPRKNSAGGLPRKLAHRCILRYFISNVLFSQWSQKWKQIFSIDKLVYLIHHFSLIHKLLKCW